MSRSIITALVAGALAAIYAAWSALYAVDQGEFAYVTQFGRPVVIYDGAKDAGLHVKWPWPIQSVQRVDRRLQMFDLATAELPTFDPQGQTIDKMLTVDGYACWQIDDEAGADRFIRTVGTPDRARSILGPRIGGRIGAVISHMPLEELVHVPGPSGFAVVGGGAAHLLPASVYQRDVIDVRSDRLQARILGAGPDSLKHQIRAEYGITLVDVRIRRFNYPESVKPAIFERIRSERRRKITDYESDGDRRAREIRSAAERDAEIVRTTAKAKAELVQKQADAEADRIRSEAYSQDKDFYAFLQKLEAYRQMLGKSNDTLLLSSKHPLFDLLLNPPQPPNNGAAPKPRSPSEPAGNNLSTETGKKP